MTGAVAASRASSKLKQLWPYFVLALAAIPAVWHAVDFEEYIDWELPEVTRPTFSRVPPATYRLAEPGDTLDRVALYLSAAGVVLAATGTIVEFGGGLWPAGLALALAASWHSATPGPGFDGWHGLGFRVMADPRAPWQLRLMLVLGSLVLFLVVAGTLFVRRRLLATYWRREWAESRGVLWLASAVLVVARQFEIPGVEPPGYWPRVALILGILGLDLGLMIEVAPALKRWPRWAVCPPLWVAAWLVLVIGGVWLTWYHRPLARLKAVEPGRIYMSAMPTLRGLEVAQSRLHFRTIINLFPEETAERSPLLPAELEFARAHGICYVGSPSNASDAVANQFLDQTLALAQDPSAWPILVHCHGCMDRTPAWAGIYRFVVQKRPLLEIMQEIERHRGYRPWASVILLYNRVLPPRAGARYWADPTALLLRRCALGRVGSRAGVPPPEANLEHLPGVGRAERFSDGMIR
jgi:hypothetical protein